jgi:hypothetical protein
MPCFFKKVGWQSLLHGKMNLNLYNVGYLPDYWWLKQFPASHLVLDRSENVKYWSHSSFEVNWSSLSSPKTLTIKCAFPSSLAWELWLCPCRPDSDGPFRRSAALLWFDQQPINILFPDMDQCNMFLFPDMDQCNMFLFPDMDQWNRFLFPDMDERQVFKADKFTKSLLRMNKLY